jgi:hypothetical protein
LLHYKRLPPPFASPRPTPPEAPPSYPCARPLGLAFPGRAPPALGAGCAVSPRPGPPSGAPWSGTRGGNPAGRLRRLPRRASPLLVTLHQGDLGEESVILGGRRRPRRVGAGCAC